ncbi:hypothetical protein SLT36_24380 [Aminobacter sp. BA135]|uniref:hypothetical protein n=1 Tax=Aminobacter sp. BA135 TaxID=537596 RepID=UPI003D7AB533
MMDTPIAQNGTLEAAIFARVKGRTPDADNFKIVSVQSKFLKGSLYTISFTSVGAAGVEGSFINRVYVHGRSIDVYGFDEQLLAIVGATHDIGVFDKIVEPKTVAAIIAIGITLLLIGLSIANLVRGTPQVFPEFLTSGFLLILGFYFGKSVGQSGADK